MQSVEKIKPTYLHDPKWATGVSRLIKAHMAASGITYADLSNKLKDFRWCMVHSLWFHCTQVGSARELIIIACKYAIIELIVEPNVSYLEWGFLHLLRNHCVELSVPLYNLSS